VVSVESLADTFLYTQYGWWVDASHSTNEHRQTDSYVRLGFGVADWSSHTRHIADALLFHDALRITWIITMRGKMWHSGNGKKAKETSGNFGNMKNSFSGMW